MEKQQGLLTEQGDLGLGYTVLGGCVETVDQSDLSDSKEKDSKDE